MASRRELGKLEDENRTLCQRLSDLEVELGRKDDAFKAATSRFAVDQLQPGSFFFEFFEKKMLVCFVQAASSAVLVYVNSCGVHGRLLISDNSAD